MNILVMDVPAEYGGALSILTDFYEETFSFSEHTWFFAVSTPCLKSKDNVEVLKFSWIKKSWFHRLYFDYFVAPRLVKKYKIDAIFSLQNVKVPFTKVKQILYVHHPVPFTRHQFKLKKDKKLWLYQNVISKLILKAIKSSQKVIVQTEWMKEQIINKTDIPLEKVHVIPPKLDEKITEKFIVEENSFKMFFYPASLISYKNHILIIEAAKLLFDRGITDFKIIFTLENNEEGYLKKEALRFDLPILFVGPLLRNEIFEFYSKTTLIFPSYVETYGLPLLEAKVIGSMILASKEPFCYEILGKYTNVNFFDYTDSEELSRLMETLIFDGMNVYTPRKSDENYFYEYSASLAKVVVDFVEEETY